MSRIITGVFQKHSDCKRLEIELEMAGFDNESYIVYITEDHHEVPYLTSVQIHDSEQEEKVKQVFGQNSVLRSYLFENMSISEATYSTIKQYIDAKNKTELHPSHDLKIKTATSGIDSEVKF